MRRLALFLPLVSLAGCQGAGDSYGEAKALIAARCGGCHVVPGVPSAVGRVGPSLAGIADRRYIAGRFANNRPTMVRWLLHPQTMVPDGGMPEVGLDQPQAMVIANYLETLTQP